MNNQTNEFTFLLLRKKSLSKSTRFKIEKPLTQWESDYQDSATFNPGVAKREQQKRVFADLKNQQ